MWLEWERQGIHTALWWVNHFVTVRFGYRVDHLKRDSFSGSEMVKLAQNRVQWQSFILTGSAIRILV